MIKDERFFIGIDLGGKDKKTTGICVLAENGALECDSIMGKDVLLKISPYLKNTKAIAIDAPLTKGRGKGNFRLYEKFLSTRVFREEKVSPLPPALMAKFCDFARDLKNKLEKRGFVLDINLIEVFPTLTKKLCGENLFSILKNKKFLYKTENQSTKQKVLCSAEPINMGSGQKSALTCVILAYLHANFKTRWLGYKDGFLFLPQMSLWEKPWRQKFYQAWTERDRLKYRRLITNIYK